MEADNLVPMCFKFNFLTCKIKKKCSDLTKYASTIHNQNEVLLTV